MLPRAEHAQLAEPVGGVVPPSPAGSAARPMMLREGTCVYQTGFQNMSTRTAEKLIVQLEESGDPSALLRPYYTPESPADTTLVFESRFESGNLSRATKVSEWEYDLELSFDTNTNGHTQWSHPDLFETRPSPEITALQRRATEDLCSRQCEGNTLLSHTKYSFKGFRN